MISIKDKKSILSNAQLLQNSTKQLESIKGSVEHVKSQVENYWQSSGVSKQNFMDVLNNNLINLDRMINCHNKLSFALINYVEKLQEIQARDGGLV